MNNQLRRASEIETPFHVPDELRGEEQQEWDYGLSDEDEEGRRFFVRRTPRAQWRDVFHTQTEALTLPENVQIVVRGLCNVGNICIWGALPKHGKSYIFLSLIKALLSGNNWLDYFEVSPSKRVIYLVPEVGLRGVVKRLRKLKMLDYLYDPATNPDGGLFVQTLSSLTKLALDDPRLFEAVKDADVFVDPLIRYIDGDENNAGEQRILSNKLLNLLGCAARSVWVAHHSPKAFKDVKDITTQNVLRGTSEFAAFPDIIFGVLKTDDEKARLYIKCTDARDDDEWAAENFVEGSPLNEGRTAGTVINSTRDEKRAASDKMLHEAMGLSAEQHRILTGGKPAEYANLTEKQRKDFDFARLIGLSESDALKVATI